jgi:hypothetical protein
MTQIIVVGYIYDKSNEVFFFFFFFEIYNDIFVLLKKNYGHFCLFVSLMGTLTCFNSLRSEH